jgi:hypothetical protein
MAGLLGDDGGLYQLEVRGAAAAIFLGVYHGAVLLYAISY